LVRCKNGRKKSKENRRKWSKSKEEGGRNMSEKKVLAGPEIREMPRDFQRKTTAKRSRKRKTVKKKKKKVKKAGRGQS